MWMGSTKLSLIGRQQLSTAHIVLTNSLKLLHLTKSDFLQLIAFPMLNKYRTGVVAQI